MRPSYILLVCAVLVASQVLKARNYKIIGIYSRFHAPTTHTWIRESKTTLILPPVNKGQNGFLAIWPGLDENTGKLVQAVAVSAIDGKADCDGKTPHHKWTLMASVYDEHKGTQRNGNCSFGHPGDHVTIHYKYNGKGGYNQAVLLNGDLFSTISTHNDHRRGKRWYTAIECQSKPCGDVPEHRYIDTTIVLNSKDPDYGSTVTRDGAKGHLYTKNGGRTWHAHEIVVEPYTFE